MSELASTLSAARERSRKALAGVDLSTIVNRAGTRCVRDVLAHIASWEREVATSIRAALEGEEHVLPLPLDIDEQNERYHEANAGLTAEAATAAWEDARRELADAVAATEAAWSFRCPWGKVETVEHVVADMIEHEETHVTRIRAAVAEAS
jgi:hypothetical protein